jgi:hypothetical protein
MNLGLGAWARQRTTPPAGGRRLVVVDRKTLKLAGIVHLIGATNITATNITAALATRRPTTSPDRCRPSRPTDQRPCRGPAAGPEAEICISESICHIDSDI